MCSVALLAAEHCCARLIPSVTRSLTSCRLALAYGPSASPKVVAPSALRRLRSRRAPISAIDVHALRPSLPHVYCDVVPLATSTPRGGGGEASRSLSPTPSRP
eukprot:1927606-Prymnesium_polylepis.1